MVPTHLFMDLFLLTCFICRSLLDTTNDTAIQSTVFTNSSEPALSTFVTLAEYSLTISDYQTCEQVKCRFARGVLAISVLSNPMYMYMNILIRSTTRSQPSDLTRISFIPVYNGRQYLSFLN